VKRNNLLLLLSRIAGIVAIVLAFALASAPVANAQGEPPPGPGTPQPAKESPPATRVVITPLAPVTVGRDVVVSAQLVTASGEFVGALGNELFELWVDGKLDRRARTDAKGNAVIHPTTELVVGAHTVRVVYPGSRALAGSESSTNLLITPATLVVKVVPPMANVAFSLGGRQFVSGTDGIAKVSADVAGTYQLRVLTTDIKSADTHATFSRWGDDAFQATREVDLPYDEMVEVGFDVSHRISWSYVDLDGNPVGPERADSLAVKGTQGAVHVFSEYQPEWLLASRVVRLQGGLQEAKIQWGVESVMVDGANTVNRGQHRFYVQPGDRWEVRLLLYTAHFAARDALFGFPVGSGINLEYPDRQVRYFPAGTSPRVTVAALARGHYIASITDAPGYAPETPVAVTRQQDVQLKVISYFDLVVFVVVLGSIGLGLLFSGRPHLLAWIPTPLRRRNARRAPVWTTGALLLIMIGVPALTASYLLTVRAPDAAPRVSIPATNGAGGHADGVRSDSASSGAAVLPPAVSREVAIGALGGASGGVAKFAAPPIWYVNKSDAAGVIDKGEVGR
jgi:hypothetical protein